MEFPEPYHSMPIREWRKYMKAHANDYATIGMRGWLRSRRKWRLVCDEAENRLTRTRKLVG
jgi:hypothetical protein